MVFDHQLADDRAVPFGDGGDDHDADAAPRYLELQPDGQPGGSPGGDRMEAGSRRCFQAASERGAAVRVRGDGGAVLRDDGGDDDLRAAGFSVACEQRRADDGDASAVGVHGAVRGVLVGASVQVVQGDGVEAEHAEDGGDVSGSGVRGVFLSERADLGAEVVGSGSVHDDDCAGAAVVRDLGASGVRRELLRVQEGGGGGPGADEQDPAAGAGAGVVHAAGVFDTDRRGAAVRRGVHRAVLHPDVDMAEPVLLHLRVPVFGVSDIGGDVRGDHDRAVLLPAVQRGLPLVVEGVPDSGFVVAVPVSVRGILLLHEAGHHEAGVGDPVLRVHADHLVLVLRADGDDGVLRVLLVRADDLRGGEDRLRRRREGVRGDMYVVDLQRSTH